MVAIAVHTALSANQRPVDVRCMYITHDFTTLKPTRTDAPAQASEHLDMIANWSDPPSMTKGKMIDDIVLQLPIDC